MSHRWIKTGHLSIIKLPCVRIGVTEKSSDKRNGQDLHDRIIAQCRMLSVATPHNVELDEQFAKYTLYTHGKKKKNIPCTHTEKKKKKIYPVHTRKKRRKIFPVHTWKKENNIKVSISQVPIKSM